MKSLRNFESIAAFLSEREIDDLQAAIDTRREARAGRDGRRSGRRSGRDGAAGRAPRKGRRAS